LFDHDGGQGSPKPCYWTPKEHLVRRDLYGDVNKLDVNPEHQWDLSFLPPSSHMREVTRPMEVGTSSAICGFLRREDELMTELMNHKRSTS
jgi:hypothetical protein